MGVNVAGSQKNLILVSPTGSGKMDVPFLSVLALRELTKNPEGVCIVTQPLTSIMNEKLKSNICPVASLSMTGKNKRIGLETGSGNLQTLKMTVLGGV